MAAAGWGSIQPVRDQLRESCAQFDWFQLVRLLITERSGHAREAALNGAVERSPSTEPDSVIRFRADLSLGFPANEVTGVVDADPQAPVTVFTPNYSIGGYLGPLPETYTEWLLERRACGDGAMADFVDLFNHRVACLRYRIKARHYPGLDPRLPQDTPWAARLAAVLGLSEPEVAQQLPVSRRALLGLAGLLGNRRRNIDCIERVVSRYFGAPAEVVPLRGAWQPIAASDLTLLRKQNSVLGRTTVLGKRVWDQAACIEVRIGPLPYDQVCAFLPSGERFEALAGLLRFLTDRQVDCRVRMVATAETVPGATLSTRNGSDSLRLGRTTWLEKGSTGVREAEFLVPAYAGESHDVAR